MCKFLLLSPADTCNVHCPQSELCPAGCVGLSVGLVRMSWACLFMWSSFFVYVVLLKMIHSQKLSVKLAELASSYWPCEPTDVHFFVNKKRKWFSSLDSSPNAVLKHRWVKYIYIYSAVVHMSIWLAMSCAKLGEQTERLCLFIPLPRLLFFSTRSEKDVWSDVITICQSTNAVLLRILI